VLVEEVGPGRQRDRRAGQRLGLLELSAGGQDPGPEPLPDHLGGQVLASGRLPARLDEPLRLVGAALGRERLGQKGRGGRKVVVLAHLFETLVVAA
jgi:hypothetical protein